MRIEPLTGFPLAGTRAAGPRPRGLRRWAGAASVVAVALSAIVVTARGQPPPGMHGTGLGISVALAGLVIGMFVGTFTIDRWRAGHIGGLALTFAGSEALLWCQSRGNGGLIGAALTLTLVAALMRRQPPVLAAVVTAAFAAVVAAVSRHHPLTASLAQSFPVLAICLLALLVGRLRDAKERAETLLARLEQGRRAEARAAALAERQRLAREMHDVLAHSLSGLMLQLEGARMLAASTPSDPRLPEAVERAHQLARDGLDEARHAIGMLRGEELPGPAVLSRLTGQFERHSGIRCSFATSGQPRTVRPDSRLALYRVTQEALTNVVRHAAAERVEVRLAYSGGGVGLTIEDFAAAHPAALADGAPAARGADRIPAGAGGGYGLTGMRERAELIGGTLTAGATPAGFRVELRIPA